MSVVSIRQGDIWLVDFEPQIGSEITKMRPAVVVDSDDPRSAKVRMVVPITTWRDKFSLFPWFIELSDFARYGLMKKSAINCQQAKTFSFERFRRKLGEADGDTLFLIHSKIAKILHPDYELIIL